MREGERENISIGGSSIIARKKYVLVLNIDAMYGEWDEEGVWIGGVLVSVN